jgi:serine/threonine protein kinase
MTPERWREVERLYQAALEHEPEERSAFLTHACGRDETLRGEVESLLAYQPRAKEFIETPASRPDGNLSFLVDAVRRLHESSVPGRFVGRTFGSYEVKALIAAGGMGEVYRAVDTRLDRIVAIKILPEHLADDAERRERFKREAKIVSGLNHPHICALYDVGTQDGIHYIVMEHVGGETLEKRLQRGPLPLEQALEFLIQIVDALDKAHRRGVVHRDLKPANVMLTKLGVKLLDFGLAARLAARGGTVIDSPARHTSQGLTVEGRIMGTVPYMAPEQFQGKPPDVRTDIFAVGVIAHETITGRRAFEATTQAELIGAILRDDAQPIEDLVPDIPLPLARALARCLSKDPDERWQTANDLLFHVRSLSSSSGANVPTSEPPRISRWLERTAWAAIVVASIAGVSYWTRSRDVRDRDSAIGVAPVRFQLSPAEGTFFSGSDVPLALSPDGRQIAYVATAADGTRKLWVRSLYSEQQHDLPGTDGARTPFWSPDSQWLGFFAANTLRKVRVSSGLTQIIASDVSTFGGAAWNVDDVIIFPGFRGGLTRVSAKGGPVSRVTIDEGTHFSPQFLRDGKHFVYASGLPGTIRVGTLGDEPPRTLMTFPVRISTLGYAPGYVFFVQDSTLFARPFDEQRLEFSGDPIPIVDGIPITHPARAPFSVSAAGVLAYWPYPLGTPAVLRWFERDGRASSAVDAPAQYRGFALSPDGHQLMSSRLGETGGSDLWLRDFARNSETQMTFDGTALTPQWSPDASRIVFSGYGPGPPPKLFVRNMTAPGAPSLVAESRVPNFASSWSADGRSVVSVRTQDPANRHDLWIQRLQDGVAERLAFNTPFNESHGKVSPDGHWIAYTTDESGKVEIWVASFPAGESRRQVSLGGGTLPQWGEASKEIVYVSDDKQLMASPFHAGNSGIEIGRPKALFRIANLIDIDQYMWPTFNAYVATSNGQRFLVAVSAFDPEAPPISVIVNWAALLTR